MKFHNLASKKFLEMNYQGLRKLILILVSLIIILVIYDKICS